MAVAHYYYVDLNRDDCQALYNKVFLTNDVVVDDFNKTKIKAMQEKFNKDDKLLTIGLPLINKSTKEILTILEENDLYFEINTHHN